MRIETRDGTQERAILTAMIVDRAVLGTLSARWPTDGEEGLFRTRYANLVAGWCIRHYTRYGKTPGPNIQHYAEQWAAKARDKESGELVDRFLAGLSDDYKALKQGINSDYILDTAAAYFNRVKAERLAESIQDALSAGKDADAQQLIAGYNQIACNGTAGIDVLQDTEAMRKAFEDAQEQLVQYPGALGEFFNGVFERDAFVAFWGSAGRGKSWWLLDLAWRAMLQRRRVAFFEVGDMSQNQVMRRFMIRAARHPRYACKVNLPTALTQGENYTCISTHETKHFAEPLDWQTARKACERVMQTKVKSTQPYLRLSCHPSGSLTADGVATICRDWERDYSFVADFVVIDYADLLAALPHSGEGRDQINATWRRLRGLSQEFHNCVVTATQSDAASYNANLMRRSNFSDDRRKNDHVTATIAINVTDAEKEAGVCRLNKLKLRDREFVETHCVHVAQCLALGNPAVLSRFWKDDEDE